MHSELPHRNGPITTGRNNGDRSSLKRMSSCKRSQSATSSGREWYLKYFAKMNAHVSATESGERGVWETSGQAERRGQETRAERCGGRFALPAAT
jgi:hypothetical protein